MRFTLFSLAAFFTAAMAASGCTPGQTSCGAGPAANTIMVCSEDGVPRPVTTCGNGQTCQNVGANNGPTCA